VARRSLEDRAIGRAARREAAADPSGNQKLLRFAIALDRGLPPTVALLESGVAVRKDVGPLSVEERQELEAFADSAMQDPRVVAYLAELKIPAKERLEKAADRAAFQQEHSAINGANERVKLVSRQDLMNRGGHPSTTVQRVENTQSELAKLSDDELQQRYEEHLDEFKRSREKAAPH